MIALCIRLAFLPSLGDAVDVVICIDNDAHVPGLVPGAEEKAPAPYHGNRDAQHRGRGPVDPSVQNLGKGLNIHRHGGSVKLVHLAEGAHSDALQKGLLFLVFYVVALSAHTGFTSISVTQSAVGFPMCRPALIRNAPFRMASLIVTTSAAARW